MTDLWPDIKSVPKQKTPNIILQEQASLLKEKTNNIVEAETRRRSIPPFDKIAKLSFMYDFFIKAPSLKYQYKLFTIMHDVFLYPTYFDIDSEIEQEILSGKQGSIKADNESEYLDILRMIFNSSKTIKIIQSIISQVT
jgi:hypothetical protein